MRTEAEIQAKLKEIQADERLGYPPASVQINAPLALIQVSLASEVGILTWVLEGGADAV